ncbi:MAG: hypothetical protein FH749_12060 [Firmicutes bacterium]|nr:hypothetical protein [Bacillota bacterium]
MRKPFISLILIVLVGLTACTASNGEGAGITVAIPADPDGFHPHHSVAAASAEIAFNIYEGLVKAGADGSVQPALAEEWSISADGLTYEFTLRPDIMFHNGRPLEAEDVIHSLGRLFDEEVTAKAREFAAVDTLEAAGDKIIITLSRPDAAFLALLTEFGASIYPREAEEQLDTRPVGTGPFVLTDWQPNNRLELTRFEHYWQDGLPLLDTVTLQIIPDPNTAVTNLRTGHVDLIPRLEPDYMHQVEEEPGLKFVEGPMNLVQLLAINNAREPFDNLLVRQAINYAIDREEIIEGAAWGYGTMVGTNLSPAMGEWYNPEVDEIYSYSPEKARELLAEAGYADGFSAVLHLPAPYPLHINAGQILAHQLEQVGIELSLEIIEWSTWLEQIYQNRDFELTVIGFTGKLDPHSIIGRYQSDSSRNLNNFDNDEYDSLIRQGLEATDPAERQEIYRQVQEILALDAAAAFIMDPNQIAVMAGDIEGWQNYPVYVLDLAALSRR